MAERAALNRLDPHGAQDQESTDIFVVGLERMLNTLMRARLVWSVLLFRFAALLLVFFLAVIASSPDS